MDLMQEVNFSEGVGKKCYKCGGAIKSRKNLVWSLTSNAWGHKKCSRFAWSYRKKHLDDKELNSLYAKQLAKEIGIA